jgi:hypothetical protein
MKTKLRGKALPSGEYEVKIIKAPRKVKEGRPLAWLGVITKGKHKGYKFYKEV